MTQVINTYTVRRVKGPTRNWKSSNFRGKVMKEQIRLRRLEMYKTTQRVMEARVSLL